MTGTKFLIDSGSDVSVLPATFRAQEPSEHKLYAANNTTIHTYGTKIITISLGLRRNFTWKFIIASTDNAIIGADFLHNFDLVIDLHKGKLIDGKTKLSVAGNRVKTITKSLCTVAPHIKFRDILKKFPEVTNFNTKPTSTLNSNEIKTFHFIETKGPPVHAGLPTWAIYRQMGDFKLDDGDKFFNLATGD